MNGILGIETSQLHATLNAPIHFKPDLTYFAQVKLQIDQGILSAYPVEGHGSGDLANLTDADGFLELPRGRDTFQTGEIYSYYPYRNISY